MEREKRIKKEERRLNSIFKEYPKDVKQVIEKLIKRASFLLIITEDIEQKLNEDTELLKTTINVSQEFIKANPLLKEYRDTVKSYQSVIKQLTELTLTQKDKSDPDSKDPDKPDEFIDFCKK